mmetsp:Transcript_14407/g.34472  ORF Transcript_14407/g.34472 Transcript_14407/m.34472 type:complete len:798 (-) Transcript_14407:97-2490(-)
MSQPDTRPASASAQPRGVGANMSVALPPRDAAPRLLSADDDDSGGSSLPVSSDRKASNLLPTSDDNGRSGNVSPGEKKLDDASSTAGVFGDCGTPRQQPQEGSTTQAPTSAGSLSTQFKLSLADMKPAHLQIEEESPAVTVVASNVQRKPQTLAAALAAATSSTGASGVAGSGGALTLPAIDHPTQHEAASGDAFAVGSPSKPPDISYSHRQVAAAALISPLHAPMEVLGENDQIPDIPFINPHPTSQDVAAGRSPHSSVNSLSTPASSLGSQSTSLMSGVVTPPGYILAGGSASGGRYYRGASAASVQKPRVYSAIGSLESLNSPSSLSVKIMASQQQQQHQQYHRAASGPMLPPSNLRSATVNKDSGGIVVGGSTATIAGGVNANTRGSGINGGVNQPSLLSQAEKKGGLGQNCWEARQSETRDRVKQTATRKMGDDPGKGSKERRRSSTKGKLKSSLRHHSSDAVGDASDANKSDTERRKRSSKKKSKKKSVKIDTTSTRVIPPKPAELFRPSCDAYTPRMGRKKIEYKPAEHRTPVQKMSGSMGTISRPNFSDALRRVAMIIQQHVVKIEQRFESGVHGADDSGLFRQSMREAFTEDNFVTPRYKCTVLRLPMGRPGVVYGQRKIKVEYKLPTVEEIYDFGHQLFQAVQLSSECSIVCLIYVERLMEVAKVPLLADTWKPIFMAGLLLASKVWQDLSSWNIEFASVYPQFSLHSINRLELQFLKSVKWDLYISSSLYAKYYFALRSLLEKQDFRRKYNRLTGVGGVTASEAMKVQKRTERVKEEALVQLSRSM